MTSYLLVLWCAHLRFIFLVNWQSSGFKNYVTAEESIAKERGQFCGVWGVLASQEALWLIKGKDPCMHFGNQQYLFSIWMWWKVCWVILEWRPWTQITWLCASSSVSKTTIPYVWYTSLGLFKMFTTALLQKQQFSPTMTTNFVLPALSHWPTLVIWHPNKDGAHMVMLMHNLYSFSPCSLTASH